MPRGMRYISNNLSIMKGFHWWDFKGFLGRKDIPTYWIPSVNPWFYTNYYNQSTRLLNNRYCHFLSKILKFRMILDEKKVKVEQSSCMSQWKLQYLVHHYQPSSGLELDVTTVLFFSRIQFKIHTTLISFSGTWQFLSHSLFSMILTVLKSTSEVFCKIEIAIF